RSCVVHSPNGGRQGQPPGNVKQLSDHQGQVSYDGNQGSRISDLSASEAAREVQGDCSEPLGSCVGGECFGAGRARDVSGEQRSSKGNLHYKPFSACS